MMQYKIPYKNNHGRQTENQSENYEALGALEVSVCYGVTKLGEEHLAVFHKK
jgi:hypothetical protein